MARFIDSAIIIMLVAVVLFCSDAAYTHAIFRELLLDGEILEKSIYSAMYNGFMLNFKFFVSLSLYGVAIPIMLALLVVFFMAYRPLLVGMKERMSGGMCRVDGVGAFKVKVIVYYILVVSCSILFIRLLIHHETTGIKDALDIRKGVVNRTASKVKSYSLKKDLYFIYCGGSRCAAFDAEDNIIRYYVADEQNVTSSKIQGIYNAME